MGKNSFDLLKCNGIKFEKGLTSDELKQIENIYHIKFPECLREFLMIALPISKGFYNWRNIKEDNVNFIKNIMNIPFSNIYSMADDVIWCNNWGKKPEDEEIILKIVRTRLQEAPKLLPIFSHRYMPMVLEGKPPVISIHGVDVIYYGKNLEDYINIEFGNKKQYEIEVKDIIPIPFWSDIM